MAIKWPFVASKVQASLQRVTSSNVHFGGFHLTFLPRPGYVAEQVVFERMQNGHPVKVAVLQKMICRGGWPSVVSLTDHVHSFRLEGLRILIPRPFPTPIQFPSKGKSHLMTRTLIADGMRMEVASDTSGSPGFQVLFPKLRLRNLKSGEPFGVKATVSASLFPSAVLSVDGRAGPAQQHKLADTPISGTYRLQNFDLSPYGQLTGFLRSEGAVEGSLGACRLTGGLGARQFGIKSNRHFVDVAGKVAADVDMLHVNANVHSLVLQFLRTTLDAQGSIQGGKQKVPSFEVSATNAQIEDLLYFFASGNPPAMRGPIRFKATTWLPTGEQPFLRRVRLAGAFQISGGIFSSQSLQQRLDTFSARTRGRPAPPPNTPQTTSILQGHVDLKGGVARITDGKFEAPGLMVTGGGIFNLVNDDVNITGKLATRGSLSRDAGGFRSVLLLPLDPFYRGQNAGAVLPVSIKGKYPNASFRVSLRRNKKKKAG